MIPIGVGTFNPAAIGPAGPPGPYFTAVPSKKMYVDGSRVDIYVEDGTILKPFKTIQAAINKIIANNDNTWFIPYTILIAAGIYVENIVMENVKLYNIIFEGTGFRQTQITPAAGLSFQSTINNDNLAWLTFKNIWFGKGADFIGQNSAPGGWLGYNMFFVDCYFSSGNVLFKNCAYPMFWGITKFSCSTLKFSNVTQAFIGPGSEVGSAVTTFTIETDQTALVKTPQGWTTGTRVVFQGANSSKDVTWSLINITTWTGTALQIRMSRFGSTGGTIPARATILAYNSTLVGNYIIAINGTLSLYGGSFVLGSLTNNATLNLYQTVDQVKTPSGAVRPTTPTAYQIFFDTALVPPRPIWWTGAIWVDAHGVGV